MVRAAACGCCRNTGAKNRSCPNLAMPITSCGLLVGAPTLGRGSGISGCQRPEGCSRVRLASSARGQLEIASRVSGDRFPGQAALGVLVGSGWHAGALRGPVGGPDPLQGALSVDVTDRDDIPTLFPAMASHSRSTTLLNWLPARPEPHESSLGGPILWPVDELWPTCAFRHGHIAEIGDPVESHPGSGQMVTRSAFVEKDESGEPEAHLVAVLQLRADDVPALRFPAGRDLMQLLWCPAVHIEGGIPAPRLYWRDSTSIGETLDGHPPVRQSQAVYLPYPCVPVSETLRDFPHPADLPAEVWEEVFGCAEDPEEAEQAYQDLLTDRWSDKAGGYPYCAQEAFQPLCASCGGQMDLMVQLFSQRRFKDEVLIQADTLAAAGIDPSALPDPGTSISFGRMERMAVFACSTCPDLPTVHNIQ